MTSKQYNSIEEKVKAAADHGAAVVALVQCLADELEQLDRDPVAIKELAGELRAAAQGLSEHVTSKVPPASAPSTPKAPDESELG